MCVIIIFDPVTSEFKEVVGPFDSEKSADAYIHQHKLENVIVAALTSPHWRIP